MKKIVYLLLTIVFMFSICSCGNNASSLITEESTSKNTTTGESSFNPEEYETKEMKVTYYMPYVIEDAISPDNDEIYHLRFDNFSLDFVPDQFLAHGDTVRITYKKGYQFDRQIKKTEIVHLERIKTANIVKIDESLIERHEEGYITALHLDCLYRWFYVDEKMITYYLYSQTIEELYMSIATDVEGIEIAVFYSFNPNEIE